MIYLDHNATTPVLPEVFEAMRPYFCEEWGNPSSTYRFGCKLKSVVETARDQVLPRPHFYPPIWREACGVRGACSRFFELQNNSQNGPLLLPVLSLQAETGPSEPEEVFAFERSQ